jgi:predicted DCC family thiol-disulfide oxidoreductase YuxK
MKAETPPTDTARGWIYYDADCPFCVRWVARVSGPLERRGFRFLPLQTPGSAERLRVAPSELLAQMQLLRPDGQRFGGADAVAEMARQIWWAKPLAALTWLPGVMPLGRRLYARIAANRHCASGACPVHRPAKAGRVFFEMP